MRLKFVCPWLLLNNICGCPAVIRGWAARLAAVAGRGEWTRWSRHTFKTRSNLLNRDILCVGVVGPPWQKRIRKLNTQLEVGLGISRTRVDSQWNSGGSLQGVSSNFDVVVLVNVVLTQQTRGQRSCVSAGSNRRALAFHSSSEIQSCYMFRIPKCRRKSNLGLCTTLGLAKRMRLCGDDFRFKNMFGRKICWKSALRSRILFASPEVVHRYTSDSSLHFDSQNINQTYVRKENHDASAWHLLPAAMLAHWPQVCRIKITFTLLPTNRSVSITTNSMKCLVNWIPFHWDSAMVREIPSPTWRVGSSSYELRMKN